MNVLLTNLSLDAYAGTEVYVRDLAIELHLRGHTVQVYSPRPGRVARELRRRGVPVFSSVDKFTFEPDIIHAHHFVPAMDAILRFPGVPTVYFVHDRLFAGDAPPLHSQVVRYVAVDNNCLDKLVIDNEIPPEQTEVIHNWVDTTRFVLRENDRPTRPARALIFSNYARADNYFAIVEAACREAHLTVDGLGIGMRNAVRRPEDLIGHYDVVFAKAKAAIEAMSTGASVIACDKIGLGEMMSSENFEQYRKYNFGMRTLTRPVDKELILREIAKYDREDALAVARRVRDVASFHRTVDRIIDLYERSIGTYLHATRNTDRDHITVDAYRSAKAAREAFHPARRWFWKVDGKLFEGAIGKSIRIARPHAKRNAPAQRKEEY